jgi:glycosyltransferase involved in cell wall biosynthesis
MSQAKAFVYAAYEDFGIAPVEAQACGTPVIAYGAGEFWKQCGIFAETQTLEPAYFLRANSSSLSRRCKKL